MTVNRRRLVGFCLALELMLSAGLASAGDVFAEQTLRAGFYARAFPDISVEDLEISVKLLAQEIGKQVGIQTTVTVFEDIEAMRGAFEQGRVNFVVASALNLAQDFDKNLLADGFRLTLSNDYPDSLLVLTRKNEGLDSIKALRGKRLALVEYDPIADMYMDVLARSTFKKDYRISFQKILREKKAHQAILKLFFGQADVICIYENAYRLAVELNPQILAKLQIISQLKGIPQGVGLFHKKVSPSFREQVITETVKLGTHARGLQLLQLFNSDKAIRASLADLTETQKLYSDEQRLRKNR